MRRIVRSAVVAVCAAACMSTVVAPAASASPLSDFIDSLGLDLGSSGQATDRAPAPFTVTYTKPLGTERVYFASSANNCIDIAGIPETPFAAGPSVALEASIENGGRCDGTYGTLRLGIAVVGPSSFSTGSFDLRLSLRGNLFLDCVSTVTPGVTPLTCTSTTDSVTFS